MSTLTKGCGGVPNSFSPSLLDDFNRSDGDLPAASYTGPTGYDPIQNVGNRCGHAVAQGTAIIWNTAYQANQQIEVEVGVVPASLQDFRLLLRIQSATAIDDCYYAQFIYDVASNTTVRFWKKVSGQADAQVGTDVDLGAIMVAGQKLGFRTSGTTLTCYLNGVSKGTITDSTHSGSGRLGLYCSDETGRLDNLRGGSV